jgi:Protein of unknown function (DUF1549)/Protein of unknown function (DUF1553)
MTHLRLILLLSSLISIASAKGIRALKDPVKEEIPLTDADRDHWAFRSLTPLAPPALQPGQWAHTEIDHFIWQKLADQGLSLSPQADAATLIRRVSFDLIGLPPTRQEVQAFITAWAQPDLREATYEGLVDRLLASDRHGEAWAQSWLDLARYAETDGFEHDKERSKAWAYRDWVISAINRDLPYDEFVAQQIAGDETTPNAVVATGFLLAGPDMPDSNFQDERMHLLLNDLAGTFGSAFLGLTIGCAQCHDHPYDPVSQADFYRLRACFDNFPKLKRDQQLGATFQEAGAHPRISKVCLRGDHQRPGAPIAAGFPRIANPANIEVYAQPTSSSSGRRAALARWLTQPTNALFLRTTVNRLWMQHIGQPLAASPNDLGTQGEAPTHPELIDWLARQLPQKRWSMKAMHKLIVMSATYRQISHHPAAAVATDTNFAMHMALQKDPANHYYARFPRQRLTGEKLRDAMLFATGRLSVKMGGPSVHLALPPEIAITLLENQRQVTADASEHDRRSIYVHARRNLRYPLFDAFDRPDALVSCARRSESTIAPQALMLFNSSVSHSLAQSLAEITLLGGSEPDAIITEATWRCLSRAPTVMELNLGRHFLESQTAETSTFSDAVADYCLALLNTNAFSYID